MSEMDDLYDGIAAGNRELPDNGDLRRLIAQRATTDARSATTDTVLGALRVAEKLGPAAGNDIVKAAAASRDAGVRRAAFDTAVRWGADGQLALRAMLSDPEPAIAVSVLDTLLAAGDAAVTMRARQLLRSPHPAVRARSAVYLAHLAGPSVEPFVKQLTTDADEQVKRVAQWAVDKLSGKPVSDQPPEGPKLPGLPQLTDAQAAPAETPAAPPADTAEAGAAAVPPAEVPSPAEAPTPAPKAADSPEDVLRKLGRGELSGDAAARAVAGLDLAALTRAPSSDTDAAAGLARAAGLSGENRWAMPVRKLLTHASPVVRAHAAEALGAIGTPATMHHLVNALGDDDPSVRAATAAAIAAASRRTGEVNWAERALTHLANEKDEVVQKARDAALANLE